MPSHVSNIVGVYVTSHLCFLSVLLLYCCRHQTLNFWNLFYTQDGKSAEDERAAAIAAAAPRAGEYQCESCESDNTSFDIIGKVCFGPVCMVGFWLMNGNSSKSLPSPSHTLRGRYIDHDYDFEVITSRLRRTRILYMCWCAQEGRLWAPERRKPSAIKTLQN